MEPFDIKPTSPINTNVQSEEFSHTDETKKIAIAVLLVIIIGVGVIVYLLTRSKTPQGPLETLLYLEDSSKPVTSTIEERGALMKTMEESSPKNTKTPEQIQTDFTMLLNQ